MSDGGDAGGTGGKATRAGWSVKRLWPLALLALGLIAYFALDLDRFATCEALRDHRQLLLGFVEENSLTAVLVFFAVYTAAIAFSLPGGALLSIAGGFLFGILLATGLVVVAATLGATILFMIAKTALGDTLRAKAGPWVARMAEGFQDNAFSYLMVLRLVPLFPFWLVNLMPAFLGMAPGSFVLATFIGIIPGTFVYVLFGAGLGSIFDSGGECSLSGILTPEMVIALVGLAVLALVPVAYKKLKARRGS